MKYLEIAELDPINSALVFDTPECKVFGRVEAYSCKLAGADKKLYKYLEHRYQDELNHSPNSIHLHMSPFGPMTQPACRRTLCHLIATLNASYPDYDFSDVKAEAFLKQPSISKVINYINNTLFNLQHGYIVTDLNLWKITDDIMDLEDCEVYSYNPDMDSDPNIEEGAIWSFNYFFYNKKRKRILFFNLRCVSINAPMQEGEDLEFSDTDSERGQKPNGISYGEFMMGDMDDYL